MDTNIPVQKMCLLQKLFLLLTMLLCISLPNSVECQEAETAPITDTSHQVYTFKIKEMIAPNAFRLVQKAVKNAEELDADFIIMELNTYGGMVDAADSIRTLLLRTEIPTVSWINNNAASAGALISIACDSIYMSDGANIGAASVVDGEGKLMPDKYQSYMRSTMRSTAESTGRNPLIAEAMVDERIVVPGIVDSTQILTFSTSEAIKNGYCQGEANTIDEVIAYFHPKEDYKLVRYQETGMDKIMSFLLNPFVSNFLLLLILGGIWFEMQSPGVGFPILAALIGAILFFAPLYIEGLANNWEIALFLIGLLLLAAEIFVIPGFGISGIAGLACIVIALTFSLIDNDFFSMSPEGFEMISSPLLRVLLVMVVMIVVFIFTGSTLAKTGAFNKLVLNTSTSADRGYTVKENKLNHIIGKEGIVVNECKPFGRVEIENDYFEAKSQAGWIDRGVPVKVIGVDVNNVIVEKLT